MTSVVSVVVIVMVLASAVARTQDPGVVRLSERTERTLPTLEDAQRMFYSGRYEDATAITSSLCAADDLEACELRTSSLHFQIRKAIGELADRNRAWTMCSACPTCWDFIAETDRARPGSGEGAVKSQRRSGPVPPGQDRPELCLAATGDAPTQNGLGPVPGKRGRPWTRCSNGIPVICAHASRVRGSTTSSGRKCREAPLGARWRQQEEGSAGSLRGCQWRR